MTVTTNIDELKNELARMCADFVLDSTRDIAIPEPYIPHIPRAWNRMLILAESQNLGKRNHVYVKKLKQFNRELRIRRLEQCPGSIGVAPWDDGTLKLAAEAALGVDSSETAISNAVMWSRVDANGRNQNPDRNLIEQAADLWSRMLDVMKPVQIVTAGAVARGVIQTALKHTSVAPKHLQWALPSPRVLSPLSLMIAADDLRGRFPEVDAVACRRPEWMREAPDRRKILYACLAVGAAKEENA